MSSDISDPDDLSAARADERRRVRKRTLIVVVASQVLGVRAPDFLRYAPSNLLLTAIRSRGGPAT
ncbi:hypothetical protein GCM10009555_098430 [Acrocarpospora macrocephala]|uniref:Uncharacterized protein n=1 Tax=Acrocarpospora macrocephala TaxID=150177 RepID=A0A5M3WW00_9ACTN|nr:hypothetical protein [Acrocarpospora macrocephala]GES12576.1 hypothetical protein Amac_061730 [Acrocarpospora macrocephala]